MLEGNKSTGSNVISYPNHALPWQAQICSCPCLSMYEISIAAAFIPHAFQSPPRNTEPRTAEETLRETWALLSLCPEVGLVIWLNHPSTHVLITGLIRLLIRLRLLSTYALLLEVPCPCPAPPCWLGVVKPWQGESSAHTPHALTQTHTHTTQGLSPMLAQLTLNQELGRA